MLTLAELGWQRTWARFLRCLTVFPSAAREQITERHAAFLGAPRFGERSGGAGTERSKTIDRGGWATRRGRSPGRLRRVERLALDQRLRRNFPYVAALLEELELAHGGAAGETRRRAAR